MWRICFTLTFVVRIEGIFTMKTSHFFLFCLISIDSSIGGNYRKILSKDNRGICEKDVI